MQREEEDASYYDYLEKDYYKPVEDLSKAYAESQFGKLQNELMALIKEKVDNGDRKRA
jgi:hypothetical protein